MSICNRTQQECRDPQACLANGCPGSLNISGPGCTGCLPGCGYCTMQLGGKERAREAIKGMYKQCGTCERVPCVCTSQTLPPQPDRLKEGANAIRARIKEERALYKHYLGHAKLMNDIEDLHGAWDANCNASEVSCRIDGLLFALEALGEVP
jgi:hypothetical protein